MSLGTLRREKYTRKSEDSLNLNQQGISPPREYANENLNLPTLGPLATERKILRGIWIRCATNKLYRIKCLSRKMTVDFRVPAGS